MIDEDYVELCCINFLGDTYVGLARCLRIAPKTLYRIRQGEYKTGRSFSDVPCYCRKISNENFETVLETTRQIEERKRIRKGFVA